MFVAIFLLREWVLQNQDAEDGMDAPVRQADALHVQAEVDGIMDRLLAEGIQHPELREALARFQDDNNINGNDPQPDNPFDPIQRQNPPPPRHRPQDFWNDEFDFNDRNDNDRRLHSLHENNTLPPRGNIPPTGEPSSTMPGYVHDLNQTYHP